jgi:hypothetical protein
VTAEQVLITVPSVHLLEHLSSAWQIGALAGQPQDEHLSTKVPEPLQYLGWLAEQLLILVPSEH